MGHSGERTATDADLPAIAELFAAWQLRVDGRITTPAEDFVSFAWNDEAFDEATGSRIFEDGDGRPVAFGMLFYPPVGEESPQALVVTSPGGAAHRHELLAWGESRTRELGKRRLQTSTPRSDLEAATVARDRGYRTVRAAFVMEIDLADAQPPKEEPPAAAEIRAARLSDAEGLYEMHQLAFREHWGFVPESFDAWSRRLRPPNDLDLFFVAIAGDRPVAMCSVVVEGDLANVAEVATHPMFRRRGLASALMRKAFKAAAAHACARATLMVDTTNETGAVGVYERAGMTQVSVLDVYEISFDVRQPLSS
jgi:mycothiol synthase